VPDLDLLNAVAQKLFVLPYWVQQELDSLTNKQNRYMSPGLNIQTLDYKCRTSI
jgi:hypothetical protein